MIISAVPKVQELHQNLERILGEQNIEAVDFSMTGDIKIGWLEYANILQPYFNNIKYIDKLFSSGLPWKGRSILQAQLSLL